ncbi:MAG: hypothetical protein ACREFJ_17675 [Acetobacteraceae bacterium]
MVPIRWRRLLAPLGLLLAAIALTDCVAYPAGYGYAYAPAYGYYPGYYGYYSGPSISVGVGAGAGCCWSHFGGWGWHHRYWH